MVQRKSSTPVGWRCALALFCALLAFSAPGVALASETNAALPTAVPVLSIKAPAKARRVVKNGWFKDEDAWYYYSNGVTAKGWKKIGGKWYYFDPDTKSAYSDGEYEINGKYYGFDSSCAMVTGWHKWVIEEEPEDGVWVYWTWSDSSGAEVSGWKYINKKWYYFDPDSMYAYSDGDYEINGKYYGFDSSCAMVTGWHKWVTESDGYKWADWSWSDPSGAEVSGWKRINRKWYYFDPDDRRAISDDEREINGKTYYFDSSCAMVTGWRRESDDVCGYVFWSWFDASGAEASGWRYIKRKWYYFDPYALHDEEREINGKYYGFDSSCAMITGWYQWDDGWAYYGGDGAMYTGTRTVGGKTYNFGFDGRVYSR